MSIARYVLRPDAVTVHSDGIDIELGLPWYRSLPWASLAEIRLNVDGQEIDLRRATVDGLLVDELAQREDYWHIQHRARVRIPDARIGRPGEPRAIDVGMRLRIPGPLLPDGSPMPYDFQTRQDVVLAAA